VEKSADVNLCTSGFKGRSPLHLAAEYGNLEIIDCLIKAGVNVNVLDSDGNTPLVYAVAQSETEAVIYLVENGADVNLCESVFPKRSALHVAAYTD
jgi:ankyrin repeat protein